MAKKCCDGGPDCTCDLPQKKYGLKDVFNNAGAYLRTAAAGTLLTHIGFGLKDAATQGAAADLQGLGIGVAFGAALAAGGLALWEKFWRADRRPAHRAGIYASMALGIAFAAAVDYGAPPAPRYQKDLKNSGTTIATPAKILRAPKYKETR